MPPPTFHDPSTRPTKPAACTYARLSQARIVRGLTRPGRWSNRSPEHVAQPTSPHRLSPFDGRIASLRILHAYVCAAHSNNQRDRQRRGMTYTMLPETFFTPAVSVIATNNNCAASKCLDQRSQQLVDKFATRALAQPTVCRAIDCLKWDTRIVIRSPRRAFEIVRYVGLANVQKDENVFACVFQMVTNPQNSRFRVTMCFRGRRTHGNPETNAAPLGY